MPNRDGTGPRWVEIGSWLCQGRYKNSDGTDRQTSNQGGSGFGRFAMGVARGLGRSFGRGQGQGQGRGQGQGNGRGMGGRR